MAEIDEVNADTYEKFFSLQNLQRYFEFYEKDGSTALISQ
jgi:hypothetical protein